MAARSARSAPTLTRSERGNLLYLVFNRNLPPPLCPFCFLLYILLRFHPHRLHASSCASRPPHSSTVLPLLPQTFHCFPILPKSKSNQGRSCHRSTIRCLRAPAPLHNHSAIIHADTEISSCLHRDIGSHWRMVCLSWRWRSTPSQKRRTADLLSSDKIIKYHAAHCTVNRASGCSTFCDRGARTCPKGPGGR